jgi:hypothetical protein
MAEEQQSASPDSPQQIPSRSITDEERIAKRGKARGWDRVIQRLFGVYVVSHGTLVKLAECPACHEHTYVDAGCLSCYYPYNNT